MNSSLAILSLHLLLITLFCLLTTASYAAKGVVVFYKPGCDYYIVNTSQGFAVLEWYGGNDPSEGDVLVGDYESYGMKDIYNLSKDMETHVWVEDYLVSKDRALETYLDKCN